MVAQSQVVGTEEGRSCRNRDQQCPPGTQDPSDLAHGANVVGHVLEDIEGHHQVKEGIGVG